MKNLVSRIAAIAAVAATLTIHVQTTARAEGTSTGSGYLPPPVKISGTILPTTPNITTYAVAPVVSTVFYGFNFFACEDFLLFDNGFVVYQDGSWDYLDSVDVVSTFDR